MDSTPKPSAKNDSDAGWFSRRWRRALRFWSDRYQGSVIPLERDEMTEFRCPVCDHVAFAGVLAPGSRIEVWCQRTRQCRVARTKFRIAA